jgi:CBS domain-containing protein/sporulation protein YlmC with PRC-barrel domain
MATAPSRVFIARLSGVSVFDPSGDAVGRIRDVVVTLRGSQPPRVLGLAVEVGPRRRIFVPMTRVTAISSSGVITTGLVNLRRFQTRPLETLVLGELLDRKVTLIDGDLSANEATADAPSPEGEVTVLDMAMEETRSRDWLVTKVFVKRGGGAFRRRGQTYMVDWAAVSGLSPATEAQGAESLLATFEKLRPADLATVLHDLSPKRRSEVAAVLDDDRLADVLEELPEDDQVEILGKLEDERAADVLEAMAPDDAADLLGELPPETAAKLLELMEPDEAEDVRRLLTYEDYTAGGMMNPEPVILPAGATVAEALAAVRNPDLSPALASQVYVCRAPLETPTGKFIGIAHFQRLLREPPSALVSGVLDTDLEPIGPGAVLNDVTRYFATYNLVALPVVDDSDHLLGAVTVDDVLDHMLPEDWRERAHEEEVVTDGAQ